VVFLSIDQQAFPSFKLAKVEAVSEVQAMTYPYLDFSTYFGGSGDYGERGVGIVVSDDGSYYILGRSRAIDFPTLNAFDDSPNGYTDIVISKFNSQGTLLWSTFFGGNETDVAFDISVAIDGSCYIIGWTESIDFPIKNAFSSTLNGAWDVFIAKFSTNGDLLWSTFFGGNDTEDGFGIAVAGDGSCYVTGSTHSLDFPTKNAYNSTYNGGYYDAFVAKFASTGGLLWSSYLGGDQNDQGTAIDCTRDGSCIVTGYTRSSNFPTVNAYEPSYSDHDDIFVSKFSASGSLIFSTFCGGASIDNALAISTDRDGSCYLTGITLSSEFPVLNAFDNTYNTGGDAFVSKFAVDGSLLWSTFLGGNGVDRGYAITSTSDGRCYVTGVTNSGDFPTEVLNSTYSGSSYDVFVTSFSSDGFLLWSSYHGGSEGSDRGYGIAVTELGSCYVVGSTSSDNFPTKNAFDDTLDGPSDIFIVKFVDTPSAQLIRGPLVFIVATSILAFLIVIGLIFYKKRK